jgi:hypothetical protein
MQEQQLGLGGVPLDAVERAKKERLGAGPSRGGAGASSSSAAAPAPRRSRELTDISSDEADATAAGSHELDDNGEAISEAELYAAPDFGAAGNGGGGGEGDDDNHDFDDINEDLFADDDGGGSGDYEDAGQ